MDDELDRLGGCATKGDRALMELPFFSLQKRKDMEPLVHRQGERYVAVYPGHKGLATIWDKDVILFMMTVLNRKLADGDPTPDRRVRFSVYEFLQWACRDVSGRGYRAFDDAVMRLVSTTIETNIPADGRVEKHRFHWLDDSEQDEPLIAGKANDSHARLTLNRWLYRAIVGERRILTYHPDYFRLTGSIERRLYEIARKHVGHQRQWKVRLPLLAAKCGSRTNLRQFKGYLGRVVHSDSLPEYRMRLEEPPDTPKATKLELTAVTFVPKALGGLSPDLSTWPVDNSSPADGRHVFSDTIGVVGTQTQLRGIADGPQPISTQFPLLLRAVTG